MKHKRVNVLCIKHGSLYSHEYVNRLFNMVSRHCSLPFNFYCITENTTNINPEISCLPLPNIPVSGWWFKPYIFSRHLPFKGPVLYLDLDLVIVDNIDKLFSYEPKKLCTIRDFVRVQAGSWKRFNSSVMRFSANKYSYIWESFAGDIRRNTQRFRGDQDYLYHVASSAGVCYPDEWIKSYKWEIRKSGKVDITQPKNERQFKVVETNIKTPNECCIAAFHGDPRPHNCLDPYIINNWI